MKEQTIENSNNESPIQIANEAINGLNLATSAREPNAPEPRQNRRYKSKLNSRPMNLDLSLNTSRPFSQEGLSNQMTIKLNNYETTKASSKVSGINFSFKNQQIADTPYHLVKSFPE